MIIKDHSPSNTGGRQIIHRFPNGYGASVVKHRFSYGGLAGRWEIAVLRFSGPSCDDWDIDCDTPITDDVIGWLDDADVQDWLAKIEALPADQSNRSAIDDADPR